MTRLVKSIVQDTVLWYVTNRQTFIAGPYIPCIVAKFLSLFLTSIAGDDFLFTLVTNQIKIEGFVVLRWKSEVPAACKQLVQWIKEVGQEI